jgi:excisionase family DNA binding protein
LKDADSSKSAAREEILTARQLAELLKVSETTVRRLAREGRIPALRITPRLLRFQLKAVLSALDGTNTPRPAARRKTETGGADAQLTFSEML